MIKDPNYFKALLEAEKIKLTGELESIAELNTETDGWNTRQTMHDESTNADPNEVADKLEEFETNESIKDKLAKQLAEVDNALSKFEKGTYGICEISGHEIEEDRLGALPSARTCKEHMND